MADNAEKPTVKTSKDFPWCKSLESLPVFTKNEIYEQRSKSGKRKAHDTSKSIKKTLKRGLKFQEISHQTQCTQRYLVTYSW